jgi:hypothetical protein
MKVIPEDTPLLCGGEVHCVKKWLRVKVMMFKMK